MPYKNFHAIGMGFDFISPLHDGDSRSVANRKCQERKKSRIITHATTRFGFRESDTNKEIIWIVLPML